MGEAETPDWRRLHLLVKEKRNHLWYRGVLIGDYFRVGSQAYYVIVIMFIMLRWYMGGVDTE